MFYRLQGAGGAVSGGGQRKEEEREVRNAVKFYSLKF